MKSNAAAQCKAKTGGKMMSAQQAVFELKHRAVLSLNKLADRDTHQIGAEELEKAAEGLAPEMIAPFLSCVADTDAEQKTAVRKECVRVMGTLARFHGAHLAPHLPKMVASIVKRLKDSDSVVRDACVETSGVLATSIRGFGGGGGTAFVALVRPLFEALGEQNRYVQAGAALCLARVIDETSDPPESILPQTLARVVKLLKNQHFMAKPALIELIRSIIQAGGASPGNGLSAAITGILEALKSSDWTTRKAASVALAGIAVSSGHLLASYKSSCIRSLDSCRFDKVKPVRDSIMHAIQCWRALPGSGSPEPSEVGSSTKENLCGDYNDVTSASDSGWRDTSFRKTTPVSVLSGISATSTQKRIPLALKRECITNARSHQSAKSSDWHVEISVPKDCGVSMIDDDCKASERSYAQSSFERRTTNVRSVQDIKYDYDLMDDKPQCSSVSDVVSGSYDTKHVTISNDCLDEGDSANLFVRRHKPSTHKIAQECLRSQARKSLESTITDLNSHNIHECCLDAANELALIKQQLLEIETKQSHVLDILQVFMANSMDNLSTLQLKVCNLEHAIDNISCSISQQENYSSMGSSRFLKKNQTVCSSPRLSTQTPRASVESNYKQPSVSSMKQKEIWGEISSSKSRSTLASDGLDNWKDPTLNIPRNPMAKGMQKNPGESVQNSRINYQYNSKDACSVSTNENANLSNFGSMINFWKRVKELLDVGNLEAAYLEVLRCGNIHCVVKLMNRTGPVLERLSPETATDLLNFMASNFIDQGLLDGLLPWLQQVFDLSSSQGPALICPSKEAQTELLATLQEGARRETKSSADRLAVLQLTGKLRQIWAEASCRKMFQSKGQRGNKNMLADARG